MLTPLDAALLPATLAALSAVPVLTVALHAWRAACELVTPIALVALDCAAELLAEEPLSRRIDRAMAAHARRESAHVATVDRLVVPMPSHVSRSFLLAFV